MSDELTGLFNLAKDFKQLFGLDEPARSYKPRHAAKPETNYEGAPRRFLLWRQKDHSGVSGTGYVASGVEFPDKTVAVRWFGHDPSTSLWNDVETLESVHGHAGSTTIEWLD